MSFFSVESYLWVYMVQIVCVICEKLLVYIKQLMLGKVCVEGSNPKFRATALGSCERLHYILTHRHSYSDALDVKIF